LIEIGLANDNRPGGFKLGNRGSVLLGNIAKRRAGRRGRKSGDVDVIFYRERDAIQRQRRRVLLIAGR